MNKVTSVMESLAISLILYGTDLLQHRTRDPRTLVYKG